VKTRFGIKTGQGGYSYEDLRKVWQAADELGYESAWLYDHFYSLGDKDAPCLEAWTTLSALVSETKQLKAGTMVTAVSYRHPSLLAKMSATIDVVSGGRVIMGLGAGWYEEEYVAYGYTFPDASTRVKQLREALIVINKLWTEERANFKGEFYTLQNAISNPKPIQKPRPKILVGITEGRKTLPYIAVKYADGFNTPNRSFNVCKEIVESARNYCRVLGRDPQDVVMSWQPFIFIGRTPRQVDEIVERAAKARGKTTQEFREQIRERGFIVGTPDHCAQKLLEFKELGMNYFIPVFEEDTLIDPLEIFRDEVIPRIS